MHLQKYGSGSTTLDWTAAGPEWFQRPGPAGRGGSAAGSAAIGQRACSVVAGQAFDYRRGFASVLAEIDGQPVRFANTHLEVQMFEPVQVAQAAELIATFEDETAPVIMVGDFNSAANQDAPEHQKTASYRMLRNAGYADIWLREPHSVGGYTCCQAPDLTNAESELQQRLDLVLVRWGKAGFGGQTAMQVIGEEPGDRIAVAPGLTLWPSDHAAVAATLWPARGRLASR